MHESNYIGNFICEVTGRKRFNSNRQCTVAITGALLGNDYETAWDLVAAVIEHSKDIGPHFDVIDAVTIEFLRPNE